MVYFNNSVDKLLMLSCPSNCFIELYYNGRKFKYSQTNISNKFATFQKKKKSGDRNRGQPEGSLFNSFYQMVGEGATPFPCVSTI